MKWCKCGINISIMENYCHECKENLSLRDKVIEEINK